LGIVRGDETLKVPFVFGKNIAWGGPRAKLERGHTSRTKRN